MDRKRKMQIIGGGMLLGAIVLWAIWRSYVSPLDVNLIDPRVEKVEAKLERGHIHSIYHGGLQGRVRQKLHDFGIPISHFGGTVVNLHDEMLALSVCFGGSLSEAEAFSVQAVFVDPQGVVTRLAERGSSAYPPRKEYTRIWIFSETPPADSFLQLLTSSNTPLAEIKVDWSDFAQPAVQ